jgi:hypothetical protein
VTEGRGLYECIGKRNVLKIKERRKTVLMYLLKWRNFKKNIKKKTN